LRDNIDTFGDQIRKGILVRIVTYDEKFMYVTFRKCQPKKYVKTTEHG